MSSNEFLKKVLFSIQETYPNLVEPSVLSAVLPSILLSLIARETNVIVSTSQPSDMQKDISKILSTVFGIQIKRVQIRTQQNATQFLESFFLSTSPGSSSSSSHKRRPSKNSLPRSISAPRPPSSNFTEYSDSTSTRAKLPRFKTDPLRYGSDTGPSAALPQAVVISHLEKAGRAAHLALAEALKTRRISFDSGVLDLPEGFFVIYISPPGDGYDRLDIHTSLLDHFAFSVNVNQPATPLSSSPRLRSLPMSSQNYKPPIFPHNELPTTDEVHIPPLATNYINALITAIRHHPELDGMLITSRCVKHAERLIQASVIVFRERDYTFITDAHIRRAMPPILVHRLRVRGSPREQLLGLLWEKAGPRYFNSAPQISIPERRTVKAILTEILSEV